MPEKQVGRPKKPGSKKSGDLNSGEVRFTFIAEEDLIKKLRSYAKSNRVSLKNLMNAIITEYFLDKGEELKVISEGEEGFDPKYSKKDQLLLKAYLEKNSLR